MVDSGGLIYVHMKAHLAAFPCRKMSNKPGSFLLRPDGRGCQHHMSVGAAKAERTHRGAREGTAWALDLPWCHGDRGP